MKAIAIPGGLLATIEPESILDRDFFCWHDYQERQTGDLSLLRFLMSAVAAPTNWSSSQQRTSAADLDSLDRLYEIANDDVVSFLTENDFLISILNDAVPVLHECFGPEARVQLELFQDPDNHASPELLARVTTQLRPKDALHLLDQFDERWWLDASTRSKCLLTFALRYI